MYKKKEFYQLFKSVPLPFKIFSFSESGTPPENQTNAPLYYLHKMTTDLSLKVFKECGFQLESNAMLCHILIGRSFSDQQLQSLNDFQKCSHFSSTYLMGTKSELHNRMKELKQRLGYDLPFYPHSYYPPDDVEELLEVWPTKKYWIIKAPALSRAREIRIASSKEEKAPLLPYIVEEYIERPYLITGRKFDIRIYALITSINPLIIYYHKQGLSLFAVHQYKCDENHSNINDLNMHLTNYEINKDSDMFIECNDYDNEKIENSKWSLPFLWKYFDSIGIDSNKLRQEIEDVSTSAIIACMCSIRNTQNKNIKFHRKSSFEFVGVDILLDSDLKPYLLEINISPSMAGTSKLDEKIKLEVARDLYNTVRILDVSATNSHECMGYFAYEQEYIMSKKQKIELSNKIENHQNNGILDGLFGLFSDNKNVVNESVKINRDKAVVDGLLDPWISPTFAEYTIIREFIEEQERCRGFHRAYPKKKNIKQFEKCFDAYCYEDIVLNEWIKMNKRKRFEVLIENFDMYYMSLQKCCQMRDKGEPIGKINVKQKSDPENNQLNGENQTLKHDENLENKLNKDEINKNDNLDDNQINKVDNNDAKNRLNNNIQIDNVKNIQNSNKNDIVSDSLSNITNIPTNSIELDNLNSIKNSSKSNIEADSLSKIKNNNKNEIEVDNLSNISNRLSNSVEADNLNSINNSSKWNIEASNLSNNENVDKNAINSFNEDEEKVVNKNNFNTKKDDASDNKKSDKLNEEGSSTENLILIIDDSDDENANGQNDSGCQIQ